VPQSLTQFASVVQTENLTALLSPFQGEYQLQWIDDFSCVVMFNQIKVMYAAVSALAGGLDFKVAPCSDLKNPDRFDTEDLSTGSGGVRATQPQTAWGTRSRSQQQQQARMCLLRTPITTNKLD
jgi:hypothetical protein